MPEGPKERHHLSLPMIRGCGGLNKMFGKFIGSCAMRRRGLAGVDVALLGEMHH